MKSKPKPKPKKSKPLDPRPDFRWKRLGAVNNRPSYYLSDDKDSMFSGSSALCPLFDICWVKNSWLLKRLTSDANPVAYSRLIDAQLAGLRAAEEIWERKGDS